MIVIIILNINEKIVFLMVYGNKELNNKKSVCNN